MPADAPNPSTVAYYARTYSAAELDALCRGAAEAFETSAVVSVQVLSESISIDPSQAEKLLSVYEEARKIVLARAAPGDPDLADAGELAARAPRGHHMNFGCRHLDGY